MLGIDDDKDTILMADEYTLAFLEECKKYYSFNEKQEKFYQQLREDVHDKIKRNLTFLTYSHS